MPPTSAGSSAAPIPAFVNPAAGSARAAIAAIRADRRFSLRETPPERLADALRAEVASGTPRVLVSGGDGTITSAAAVLAAGATELAVLPGGTLNHFARDHEIPTELPEALELAAAGRARGVDAGEVNGRLFLNTSSVGAYVAYVRSRERLEPYFGYTLSSVLATIRIFTVLRGFHVVLSADGVESTHRTPLVFVGVGERQMRLPGFGRRAERGRRGLHVVVVRGKTRARVFAIAVAAAARGFRSVTRTPALEAFVVDALRIEMRRPHALLSTDGEILASNIPFAYRHLRDHVRVVTGAHDTASDA